MNMQFNNMLDLAPPSIGMRLLHALRQAGPCVLLVVAGVVSAQQTTVLPAAPAASTTTVAASAAALVYSLDDLLLLARRDSFALQSARAQALAGRAGVTTAAAYPNPEVELQGASFRARAPGVAGGGGSAVSLTQRIESPALRSARMASAVAGAQAGEINVWVVENNLVADIKTRFFEALRREEELDAAREDLALTEQIRERIRVRARTGEAPRFDLIRADNEVALAQREVLRSSARVIEAKAFLKQVVSPVLPADFRLAGDFYRLTPRADYAGLRDAVLAANPELKRALADVARAEQQLEVERRQVLPSVQLRLVSETEPELRSLRGGVVLSVPLWDRRRGPIDEARAQVIRSRSESEARRFSLAQGFEVGWQQYQAALASVQALEGGILQQARTVVDIAEAAYRFGERGILEYLDARRQFRALRGDLITARFELHAAKAELERLAASDIKGE